MKRILLMCLVSVFAVIKCSSDVMDPSETEKRMFIALPADTALGDTTKIDNYYMIHGSYGTTIQFSRQFTGGPFGQYSISATLTIDTGTIPASDSLLCLMSVYVKNSCVHISPIEQYYVHPFKLTITYTGLDLQQLDFSNLQFAYSNEKDVYFNVNYDSIIMDYVTGKLEVVNAIVQYDPRQVPDGKYGWVRKSE